MILIVCHFIYACDVSGGIVWGLKKNKIKWAHKFIGLPEGAFFLGGVNLEGGVLLKSAVCLKLILDKDTHHNNSDSMCSLLSLNNFPTFLFTYDSEYFVV